MTLSACTKSCLPGSVSLCRSLTATCGRKFFEQAELRDVLDTITLAFDAIQAGCQTPSTEGIIFLREVNVIFQEEHVTYRADSSSRPRAWPSGWAGSPHVRFWGLSSHRTVVCRESAFDPKRRSVSQPVSPLFVDISHEVTGVFQPVPGGGQFLRAQT